MFSSLLSLELRSVTWLYCRGSQLHSIINELFWSLVALSCQGHLSNALHDDAPEPAAQTSKHSRLTFCLCLCFFFLWKLPSPSFSCEDAYCFPNPRSVCFLSPCNKSLQVWRLNMMHLLFPFKEVGFRNWLILILCFWALHRAEVKQLGYLKAEVWRSALSFSEVD